MTRRRERLLALITVVGTLALCLGLAEVVLRFLPVATAMSPISVTAADPVFHFRPDRDFVYSLGWNMQLARRGHINNAGFVNDQDYRKLDAPPLIAVVGDSYIEAAMVPFGETVHGRLAKALTGEFRVYSFGASGAPLSQYLVWARHAVHEYGAQALVINVVGNDFDESLAAYGAQPGFWYYAPDASGVLRLELVELRRGFSTGLVAGTAIGRYLLFNLRLGPQLLFLKSLIFGSAPQPHYAGNTFAEADPQRVSNSLAAIDAFFRDLPAETGLPPEFVVFTLDGFRYPQAAAEGAGTYFDQMRRAFRAKGEALGYEVIDLDPAFLARHARTGERFEYPIDGHWNPAGHQVAYDALMGSRTLKGLARTRFGALRLPR